MLHQFWLAMTLLACQVATGQDLNHEKLQVFALQGSPLLTGFVRSSLPPYMVGRAGGIAQFDARYFHGGTELRWTVILCRTGAEAEDMGNHLRGMRSLMTHYTPPEKIARTGYRIAPYSPRVYEPHNLFVGTRVGRYVIELWAFRHDEMKRRDPASWKRSVPQSRLTPIVSAIATTLVRKALNTPEGRE